jgi:hypothetical protein
LHFALLLIKSKNATNQHIILALPVYELLA